MTDQPVTSNEVSIELETDDFMLSRLIDTTDTFADYSAR